MKWISVKDKLPEKLKYRLSKECFIPTNYKIGKKGYIGCKLIGFNRLHRLVYFLNNDEGLDPKLWRNKNKNKVIMHLCDNRSCVNPDHLKIGTQIDNIEDRVRKGRSAYHEKNGNTLLTEKDVGFIRYYYGKKTIRQLSNFFGVDRKTIMRIKSKKSWMPLPEKPEDKQWKIK